MPDRKILDLSYDSETKNKIISVATKLFALKGYSTVSTRDIAGAVGINIASVYYYFESKEALLEDILNQIEKGYRHYYDWLINENKKAESLEEFMDNIFNNELLEMADPMVCLGVSLAIKEQHNNVRAQKIVLELLTDYSIKSIQAGFDGLVEKGIIQPTDTKTIATLLVFSALAINDLRMHMYLGDEPTADYTEMYANIRKYITAALKKE